MFSRRSGLCQANVLGAVQNVSNAHAGSVVSGTTDILACGMRQLYHPSLSVPVLTK